jgi:hypothetical protein
LVKDFLAKNSVTTLEHPLFSPWLQLKSAWKGWFFCDATDISKNATEELKRLPQNGFQ